MEKLNIHETIVNDPILTHLYIFRKNIGEGCFGKIYQVISKQTKRISALKIQIEKHKNENKPFMIDFESKHLKMLDKVKGVPEIYSKGNWTYGKYIQIQLLNFDFSLYVTQSIILQRNELFETIHELITIFRDIHQKEIIHRDIKPQNFMKDQIGNIYIIDFGISKIQQKSKIKNSYKKGFIGTPRYASITAHEGREQSPKDDIQSLLYVMAHIHLKVLPWMNLPQNFDKIERIFKEKRQKSEQMFKKMGLSFLKAYRYVRNSYPLQSLDYNYLLSLFPKGKHKTYFQNSQYFPQEKNKKKRLSLSPIQSGKQNIPFSQKEFLIMENKQIINYSQFPHHQVDAIVINWVHKKDIEDISQPQITGQEQHAFEEGSKFKEIKVFFTYKNDINQQLNTQQWSCNIQPILPKIPIMKVNLSPFSQ